MNSKDTAKYTSVTGKNTRKKQITCKCPAYPFPHRAWSGNCQGDAERSMDQVDLKQEGYHERH